uniref:Cytosolic 5'-nucleotidase 1A-like n=1 Tax=Gasterosteus aculeatus aculeatus TaxID=481459 RepID=G3NU56_GASAC
MKKMSEKSCQGSTSSSNPPMGAVTICVSPRVLFNMETQPFSPGPASSFVKVLEVVNKELRDLCPESKELIKVVIITNDQVNVRQGLIESIKTIKDHELFIELRSMEDGESLINVLKANHADLYLSDQSTEVEEALGGGIAAATMFTPEKMAAVSETQLRVAFDGDAVLFSDESEQVFAREGLDKFNEHEKTHENTHMNQGPFKGFLEALGKLQKKFYDKGQRKKCPIRTYLVTSRGAGSSGTRALKTLRSWDLEMDEALLRSGAPKGPMLEKIRPHIFFDDQMFHVEGAKAAGVVACHVPYGKWVKCRGPL